MFTHLQSIVNLLLARRSDPANLSRERYRRAALTSITAVTGKAISLGASLLTVRLTYRYLGSERYGMWMTISSFVLMLGFADFGMSNGLINLVADALGKGNRGAAKRVISSAFWMLSGIAAVLTLAILCAYPHLDSSRLFNVHSPIAIREAGPALLVLIFCFIFNLPLGAVRGTQSGMQSAFSNNLWAMAGTVASLGALILAIDLHAGLPMLVLSLTMPPVFALLLNGITLFSTQRDLMPSLGAVQWEAARRILHVGGMYFVLQLAISIGMQTDNIVIAQIMGPKAVADFAVPGRLFNMVNVVLVMLSGSMWPAYADAVARKDAAWIRTSFVRVSIAGTVFTLIATSIFVIFGNQLLSLWVGPQVSATPLLLAAFGVQCVVYAYLQPIGFLLSGISQFRVQAICAVLMAVVNLSLSILLVKRYGIVGAVLGTVTAQLLVQVIPLTITTRRSLRTLDQSLQPAVAEMAVDSLRSV